MTSTINLDVTVDEMPTSTDAPRWATIQRSYTDEPDSPWFVAPVGRGYFVPGVGQEVDTMLADGDPVTFEILEDRDSRWSDAGTFIDQQGHFNAAFASPDAMRRYARILLEVADDAERILGGAR
ncbi:hypothetical protein RN607_05500 [Demequina capsici]|uniref:Uncharacterized protein n=1 Tax=Demequina capsici TaxID=3075620 RepID=A0AA96FEY7_9MICO|nr:hypothetical protein [Demequina sp. PMTSA13]WNM28457.1 hypothetical protein RN607_05500 [Demequina sp. PMTSA13]